MAITQALCNSFKQELLGMGAVVAHDRLDVFKIALFTSAATLSKATTAYAATNEVAASGSYAAGGITLTGLSVTLDTDTAILDFTTDPVATAATITARGALIYNSSKGNRAVAVIDFGSDVASTNGTFTIPFPVAAAATGLIRWT